MAHAAGRISQGPGAFAILAESLIEADPGLRWEFADTMLDPMVRGITGGECRRVSLAAAFPRMVELERDHAAAHYYTAVGLLALGDLGAAERHNARAMELGHQPPPEFLRALEKAQKKAAKNVTLLEITGAEAPENAKED